MNKDTVFEGREPTKDPPGAPPKPGREPGIKVFTPPEPKKDPPKAPEEQPSGDDTSPREGER